MKKLYFLLIIVLFFSCNKEIPIYEAKEFAKENIAINQEIQKSIPLHLKKDKMYCISKIMFVLSYDINKKNIDTLVKTNYKSLSDFYPIDDSCVYYVTCSYNNFFLKNSLIGEFDFFRNVKNTVTHPYWKKIINFILLLQNQ